MVEHREGDPDAQPRGGRRPLARTDVEAAFRDSYARVQYCLVDFLADHLSDASRAFGGDMQKVVILAVLGQAHLRAATMAEPAGRASAELPPDRRGMTTLRLADATGIARETARRKLHEMEERGWLAREGGYWLLALNGEDAIARSDLADLDDRGIARAARLFSLLAPYARRPQD